MLEASWQIWVEVRKYDKVYSTNGSNACQIEKIIRAAARDRYKICLRSQGNAEVAQD